MRFCSCMRHLSLCIRAGLCACVWVGRFRKVQSGIVHVLTCTTPIRVCLGVFPCCLDFVGWSSMYIPGSRLGIKKNPRKRTAKVRPFACVRACVCVSVCKSERESARAREIIQVKRVYEGTWSLHAPGFRVKGLGRCRLKLSLTCLYARFLYALE